MSGFIILGVALGVIASMCGTAGKQLLRFSELERQKGFIMIGKVTLVSGVVINTLVGPFVDMASYAFAPQSLVAPLGGLDVVWNTLSAPCTLGEKLTPMVLLGCAFIAGGATVTSIVGPHTNVDFTLDYIEDTLIRPAVGFYLLAFFSWLAFNVFVLMPRSAAPKGEPWKTGDHLRGLALGMSAGGIAGNMFCVKALVSLIKISIEEDKIGEYFTHWVTYLVLVGAVFFATSNLYFLTKAMREYDALFMGAVFEGSLITSASISGCLVFRDLEGLAHWRIVVYCAALLALVIGIFIVVYGVTMRDQKTTDEVAEEGEAAGNREADAKSAPWDTKCKKVLAEAAAQRWKGFCCQILEKELTVAKTKLPVANLDLTTAPKSLV